MCKGVLSFGNDFRLVTGNVYNLFMGDTFVIQYVPEKGGHI